MSTKLKISDNLNMNVYLAKDGSSSWHTPFHWGFDFALKF